MASMTAGINATRFYLWCHMKSLVYQTAVDTVEELFARVLGAAQETQQPPGVMGRGYQKVSRRYNVCNELGGRHIEQQL